MQLTIERSALLKALGHVQSVVERRNTIPILSNVLLSAGRDRLSFAATDLDMEMVDEAEAQVNVEGQITAPAHTLYEIVKKLPDGAEVSLTYSGDVIQAQARAREAKRGVEIGYDLRPVGGYFAIGGKGHPGALEQRAAVFAGFVVRGDRADRVAQLRALGSGDPAGLGLEQQVDGTLARLMATAVTATVRHGQPLTRPR